MNMKPTIAFLCAAMLLAGCSRKPAPARANGQTSAAMPAYFHVDPATAGSISGTVHWAGKRPAPVPVDLSSDPACVQAHQGKAYDESLVLDSKGDVANAFIYIKSGLEGKTFPLPAAATIDQRGCWFRPHILGLQTGQELDIINSDPVTHNIHPMAQINREWNHSQGPGDPPMHRKFLKPEIMVPVKCNIHGWMRAYIGVVEHPYFAVSGEDGAFTLPDLPPGTYTVGLWHEKLGTHEQQITVAAHSNSKLAFELKDK